MPRIRTIKPEMFGDEKLAAMSVVDRFVFIGLIAMADDAGRMLDSARAIDGFIFPLTDNDSSRASVDRLVSAGLLIRYESDSGQRLLQIANWSRHQKVDHAARHVLPPPREGRAVVVRESREDTETGLATSSRGQGEDSAQSSRLDLGPTTVDHGPTTMDLRPPSAERTVRVRDKRTDNRDAFAVAWLAYPAREGGNPRKRAEHAYYARRREGVTDAELLAGIERYAAYCTAKGLVGGPYVMGAARFFGPEKNYAEPWAVSGPAVDPHSTGDARLDAKLDAREREIAAAYATIPGYEDAPWVVSALNGKGAA